MSYIDSRLINLNSSDAIRLNDTKLSNVQFNFSNVLKEEKDIIFSSGGVSNASFCFSFYNINDTNNAFDIAITPATKSTYTYNVDIAKGMYNATSLLKYIQNDLNAQMAYDGLTDADGVQMYSQFNYFSATGRFEIIILPTTYTSYKQLLFDKVLQPNTVFYTLGLIDKYTTGSEIATYDPSYLSNYLINMLGVKKINVYSSALANTSLDSKTKSNNDLVRSINVDVPPYGLISFSNSTGIYGKFKNKRINNIDIRLLDENENFIDFNNVDWVMSIQIIMTKKLIIQDNYFDRNTLANLSLPKENQQTINKNEKQDSVDLLNQIKNDLDLLTYN
jgi:hypothetical protein